MQSTPSPLFAVRVRQKIELATDIVSLILMPEDGRILPPYTAGAHIDVQLPNGMLRQYSLCRAHADGQAYEIAILRDPEGRGGSACAHRDVQVGSRLLVGAPRNLFPLVPAARSVLLAGGIGITPILAMAEELHRQGRAFEMHYCARSPGRAAYRDTLGSAAFARQVHFHFDDAPAALRFDAARALGAPAVDRHLYVCGPEGFIRHVVQVAADLGWDPACIHFEYFSGAAAPTPDDGAFELRLVRSGLSVPVPAGVSAAQALLDHGIEIALSCEQGVCGACVLPVLEGIPEHRDVFLSAAEKAANRCFTPCCSRALTPRLLIDL
ncbi:MAG: PDR/VanB family oxidoreductase [Proteobacteria bacterium]|nr:PDR/VanB family oxidoreductase [Pseudomonadota bacterium]